MKNYLKKSFFILLIFFSISLFAQTVKVAAAANLRYVLEDIKVQYELKNPKSKIILNFGSSGAFVQQITNGADFDLFMAADKWYPETLKTKGLVTGKVETYAFGKLVIWSNTFNVSKGLKSLTDVAVKRIAIAKPDLAPYGARAVECLKYYKIFEKLKNKIVYADNISQSAQFAQTGNAEIGFIALSLTMTPEMKGSYFVLDPKSYQPVEQAMVLVKSWQSNPEAAKFMKFVLSTTCKPIFEKHGFLVP